ncbi:bile acid:sodium symporter [Rhizobium herbae]|uniref:Bile acid:sodium symporter n=1 Tax=Rhizobium herbae TaxID=508661 RepID=A0ABS7H753_9HYPH|nr:bile acid:sodium symporter family protein [Rhizobium herbae]MBW9063042.1 bile acid:sodium symporter [Rhizobium herbae]
MLLRNIEAGLKRVSLDRYLLILILTVVLATILPAQGGFATVLSKATFWAVALLFFLYGAKLSLSATLAGLTNWKLQAGCLACTYMLFPVLALGLFGVSQAWFPAAIGLGFLYLGCLPSTVQSSIAFTSVAGGNVAGALCAASLSNLLGVVLCPLLLAAMLHTSGGAGNPADAVWKIAQQILLPFFLGQLLRPLLSNFLNRNKQATMIVDRGSILLIVYSAFSAGVVAGIWHRLSWSDITLLVILCVLLLGVVMPIVLNAGLLVGMPRGDRLALLFCGSTKSLATGLPMAGILFDTAEIALIVLPLMLFHLIQLSVLAVLSQRSVVSVQAG